MSRSKNAVLIALLWVVFVDSLGAGLAFSVFTVLFFDPHSSFFSLFSTSFSRNLVYEILLGLYSFCMFFGAPIIGEFSDRYGRKPILIFCMAGLTIGFVLSAVGCFYSALLFLIIGRIVAGATAGSISVAQAAVADLSNKTNKSFYLSLIVLANCIGFSCGPLFSQIFIKNAAEHAGSLTFIAGAILSLITLLLIFLWLPAAQGSAAVNKKISLQHIFLPIAYVLSDRTARPWLISFSCSMLAYCVFFATLPLFIDRLVLADPIITGYLLSSLAVFLSLSSSLGGKYLFKKRDKTHTLHLTQLTQMIGFLILAACWSSLVTNTVLFITIALCFGLIYLSLLTIVSDVTAADAQGRIMGVMAAISSLAWAIGAFVSGWLNMFGTSVPFLICAGLTSIAILTGRSAAPPRSRAEVCNNTRNN